MGGGARICAYAASEGKPDGGTQDIMTGSVAMVLVTGEDEPTTKVDRAESIEDGESSRGRSTHDRRDPCTFSASSYGGGLLDIVLSSLIVS